MKKIDLLSMYIDAAMTSDEESLNRIHFMLVHGVRMHKARRGKLREEASSRELNERFYDAYGRHLENYKINEDER